MCGFGFSMFLGSGQHIFQRIGTKFPTELKLSNAANETGNTNRTLGMCKFHGRIRLVYCGTTLCETVRHMPWARCLSVCPVCDVGVLWPNGWMDQDVTWQARRPQPWPHYVRWDPALPPPKVGEAHNFQSMSIVPKRLDGWRYHLVRK